MNRPWRTFLGVIAAYLTLSPVIWPPEPAVQAQARDTYLVWRTLHTRHFEITYHEPLGLQARRIAVVAERAHTNLTRILGHTTHEKTFIVLSDTSDSANGSATALPRNTIRLFATAPEDLSPLSDYDDWLTTLVTHENTHVVHLDNIGGIPALVNKIFGKVYAPNELQPRWFIEGLAVVEESKWTGGGRIRSTFFDMYLRMDALENRLLHIDQVSHEVDRWPHGNSWYLYGSRFVQFIADTYGDRALAQIAREYGRQAIPYGLNRIAKRATGRTFIELYDDFLVERRAHYLAVAEELRKQGIVEGTRITFHGEELWSPRFLDNHRVIYFAQDGRSLSTLRTVHIGTGQREDIVRAEGSAYVAPEINGSHIYFSAFDTFRDIYGLFDLFSWDANTQQTVRLTEGLRAREPDVSADGRHIVFTVNSASTTHLAISRTDSIEKTTRILLRNPRFDQIYTPRFSPRGDRIAYSVWRRGGYRDVEVLDLRTKKITAITHDRAFDSGPCWSPDGARLYFSSDRTGIADIYAYHFTNKTIQRVTRVVSGAFQPAISPDGSTLVYSGYTSRGFDLFRMKIDPTRFMQAPPYHDDRPPPSEAASVAVLRSEPYSPLPTLLPRSYEIDINSGPFGPVLGVSFSASDIVGWHSYAGRVGVALEHGYVDANLSWQYDRLILPIHASVFRRIAPRGGLAVGGVQRTWIENAIGGSVGVSYSFPRAFHSEGLSVNYSLTHLGKGGPFGGTLDPNTPPPVIPQLGYLANLSGGWFYSTVRRQVYDISASSGTFLGTTLSIADPTIGSQYRSVWLAWSASKYFRTPWLNTHFLAMHYQGGISGGDLNRRGIFSVGGFPETDFLDSLYNQVHLGGVALRGYPPFVRSGTQYHLLQTEYRFLIFRPQRGIQTLPTYLNRIYGSTFVDVGDAFSGDPHFDTLRVGTGAELFTDFTLGYYLLFTLRMGFAYGFMQGGGPQYYVHLGVPF